MRKHGFAILLALTVATSALAQKPSELNNPLPRHFPTKERFVHEGAGSGGAGGNLVNHGGPVITNAYVVPIFWGPSWKSSTSPNSAIAASLTFFIDGGSGATGYGKTGEYNVITQYSSIRLSNLGTNTGALYDTSAPPTNVTDAAIQAEVIKVLRANSLSPRADTIYEVFLPSSSYSSSGSATSCGGPNLQYCAYHGNFSSGGLDIKYASMPYPSCGGCRSTGFTVTQNLEHFISHETREAVTDPDGTAWFDHRGYEADDKCAWSPTPFADSTTGTNADGSGFAYQYEWSNANSGCVKTR
jgi:hypothetical protein